MSTVEPDIQEQLSKVNKLLESSKLAQRDAALKSSREIATLKRLILTLSSEYRCESDEAEAQLLALRSEIELHNDISKITARLAIVERVIRQDTQQFQQKKTHFDNSVQQSGEFLQRFPVLPRNLKQDLRELITRPHYSSGHVISTASRLLQIYETALKNCVQKKGLPDGQGELDTTLLKQLNAELQTLIMQLDFAGDAGEMLADIRAKLMLGCNGEDLIRITLSVLKLVIDGTDYERQSSQSFLSQVNESLGSIKTATTNSLDQARAAEAHRDDLNQELQESVSSIHSATKALEQEARVALAQPLTNLKSLADRFISANQREQHLLEQLQYTESQLEALSEVTEDYRRRLDEQQQRAKKDPLTQLYNHTAILDIANVDYQKWIRAQNPMHVALFDIIKFKDINDAFGYTAGDKALTIIARTIKEELGHVGEVGRFAGEKFLLVIRNQSDTQCQALLERIRSAIGNLPFRFKTQDIRINASVACSPFQDSLTTEESIELLLKEIMTIKRQGSNSVHWV